ncbi:MAG TPA: GAF domain-containing SpoIIE family protein phosphatase [Bryobacteraceae bacterium]|nr:GAF domain-containing SpoIIE family protein phosphatase [Bryobacteraceae bacterium]
MSTEGDSTTRSLQQEVQHLALLEDAAHRLSSTLDLDELLEKIVEEVALAFGCSRSAVLLANDQGTELELVAVHGWTMSVHPKGFRFAIGRDGLVGKTAKTGRTSYVPDVLLEPSYVVSEQTTRSELDIPLKVYGKVIGVFNAQHPEVDAFPESLRKLLEALADHLSTAIENARLFRRERLAKEGLEKEYAEAHRMQMALLPQGQLQAGGFSIRGACLPMHAVGGDWFDFFLLDDHRIAIALGDVSGKGIPAALLMASTRSGLRQQAKMSRSPSKVLNRLNNILLYDFPQGNFVTLVYAILDTRTAAISLAAAGHPPPILSLGRSAELLAIPNGLPLGIKEQFFEQRECLVAPGSSVLIYSDGLAEAANPEGEEFGVERIRHLCSTNEVTPESLIGEVRLFSSPGALNDDATALLITRES